MTELKTSWRLRTARRAKLSLAFSFLAVLLILVGGAVTTFQAYATHQQMGQADELLAEQLDVLKQISQLKAPTAESAQDLQNVALRLNRVKYLTFSANEVMSGADFPLMYAQGGFDKINILAERIAANPKSVKVQDLADFRTELSRIATELNDYRGNLRHVVGENMFGYLRRTLITYGFILGVVALFYTLLVWPRIRDIQVLAQEAEEKNEQLQLQADLLSASNEHVAELNLFLESNHQVYASAARQLDQLFKGLPVATFSYDRYMTIQHWNDASSKLFGIPWHEAVGRTWMQVIPSPEESKTTFETLFETPLKFNERSRATWKLEGEFGAQYLETLTFPLLRADGDPEGAVAVFIDATEQTEFSFLVQATVTRLNESQQMLEMQKAELEEANARLELLATRDGLTGLYNHRAFQDRLAEEFALAGKGQRKLALALLDVDHFKKFNDTYGHQEGDFVLQEVARVLEAECPGDCMVARYGGEEFVVVFSDLSAEDVVKFSEHFRKCIEGTQPNGRLVTASFGVAFFENGLYGPPELIARADKALYHSKHEGRNRVTVAHELWASDKAA